MMRVAALAAFLFALGGCAANAPPCYVELGVGVWTDSDGIPGHTPSEAKRTARGAAGPRASTIEAISGGPGRLMPRKSPAPTRFLSNTEKGFSDADTKRNNGRRAARRPGDG